MPFRDNKKVAKTTNNKCIKSEIVAVKIFCIGNWTLPVSDNLL